MGSTAALVKDCYDGVFSFQVRKADAGSLGVELTHVQQDRALLALLSDFVACIALNDSEKQNLVALMSGFLRE